ncbi:uncharacterized protein Triagg1_8605 [Trichoderma aggressivum f. europaeum]|uniref:Uncharacterized protein n=1 Tax=Trichoderma aggressivum f. europaeum TaxID=173218 RepID=A0AAE1J095_9HYPO|nr:hypothetical protein Triagg1_8605 [Trichoderma aggressivum f. europaeum]
MSNNPYIAQKDAAQSIIAQKDTTQSFIAQKNATEPIQDDDTEDTRIIQNPGEAKIDIVFVHGLIVKEAWTSDGRVFWPDRLLASKVPEARILSFEYSEKISPIFEEGTQIPVISDRLLSDLVDLRKGTVGGVILEDAIVRASTSHDQREKGLVPCIRGILLLGTPHFKEGLEEDAKKYFEYARSPESPAFNEQLQPLKLICQNFVDLQKTSQAKFEMASFRAGRGNAVSEALAQWSQNSRSRVLDRDQLQLSQYENEKSRDFKQVVRTITSWSEDVQESETRLAGSEYVSHATFAGSKSTGMQVGQNTSSISGLTFNGTIS